MLPTASPGQIVELLQSLPRSDRRDALEELVVREIKTVLLMEDDDELPMDSSYFDLGLTSLRLTEIRQELERQLGRGLDANLLFNRPTVGQLLVHLTDDVLADLFGSGTESVSAPAGTGRLRAPAEAT